MSNSPTIDIGPSAEISRSQGAYGVVLTGFAPPPGLLCEAPDGMPTLSVATHNGATAGIPPQDDHLTDDEARLELPGGGWAQVTREPATATLHLPHVARPTELAHPYLAGSCAVAAHWRGALTFHAGAVIIGGAAWGVLGEKGRGKSTALAVLARAGLGILADDLTILEDGHLLAGPRCLDLRRAPSALFPEAEALGMVGVRSRWRLPLAPVPWSVPAGGWLVLDWGDRLALEPVPPRERLITLAASLSLSARPRDPRMLLDAAALPMLTLTRPRDLDRVDEIVAAVSALAG